MSGFRQVLKPDMLKSIHRGGHGQRLSLALLSALVVAGLVALIKAPTFGNYSSKRSTDVLRFQQVVSTTGNTQVPLVTGCGPKEWECIQIIRDMVTPTRSIVDTIAHTRVRINRIPLALASFDWLVYGEPPVTRGIFKRCARPTHVFCEARSYSVELLIRELENIGDEFHGSTLLIGGEDTHLSDMMEMVSLTKLLKYFDNVRYEAKDIPHDTIATFPMSLLPHYTQQHNPTTIREAILQASIEDKPRLLLASWGKLQPGLDVIDSRQEAESFVSQSSWINRTSVEVDEWWDTLRRYKFMLCPTGRGIQSPKFVEAFLVLTIPIAQNISAYHDLALQGFPIVIVNEWSDLSPEYLEEQWRLLSPQLMTARSLFSTDRWFEYVTRPNKNINQGGP